MAREYDHLFKLLIIGDSGKWDNYCHYYELDFLHGLSIHMKVLEKALYCFALLTTHFLETISPPSELISKFGTL